jgi:hypothetical protein
LLAEENNGITNERGEEGRKKNAREVGREGGRGEEDTKFYRNKA